MRIRRSFSNCLQLPAKPLIPSLMQILTWAFCLPDLCVEDTLLTLYSRWNKLIVYLHNAQNHRGQKSVLRIPKFLYIEKKRPWWMHLKRKRNSCCKPCKHASYFNDFVYWYFYKEFSANFASDDSLVSASFSQDQRQPTSSGKRRKFMRAVEYRRPFNFQYILCRLIMKCWWKEFHRPMDNGKLKKQQL